MIKAYRLKADDSVVLAAASPDFPDIPIVEASALELWCRQRCHSHTLSDWRLGRVPSAPLARIAPVRSVALSAAGRPAFCARQASFADAIGCVLDTFRDNDDLRIGVAFPDWIYGFLAPLSAEECLVER